MRQAAGRLALAIAVLAATGAAAQELRYDVGRNTSPLYVKECGGCHFAYQPGWLPERSWRRIMDTLSAHFGENATLSGANHEAVTAYLLANSADRATNARSRALMAALAPGETPLSITRVLYVGGIHGGFLDPAFEGRPVVKTLAHCPACHQQAERGWFAAVTYTISDEKFRSREVDTSLSMPMPSFLRPR